jgi:DNA-binding NtrC family response regulator
MRAFAAALEQAARSDMTILLEGETGTGKDVAAEALHAASPRSSGPFVVVDCSALGRTLLTAELFGHEAGAFTGALQARAGLLERADGGTLFIDEIGELPLEAQPLLLRAIEQRTVRRIGGHTELPLDVRVVAATKHNLAEEVRARRFREDLFYRLAVVRLRVPPLRERPEDLAVLARHFAAEAGVQLAPDTIAYFLTQRWGGNVRELRNEIQRHAVARVAPDLNPTSTVYENDSRLRPLPEARRMAADEFERCYLEKALALSGGSVSEAAELSQISREVFTRLVGKHGLRRRDRR